MIRPFETIVYIGQVGIDTRFDDVTAYFLMHNNFNQYAVCICCGRHYSIGSISGCVDWTYISRIDKFR